MLTAGLAVLGSLQLVVLVCLWLDVRRCRHALELMAYDAGPAPAPPDQFRTLDD